MHGCTDKRYKVSGQGEERSAYKAPACKAGKQVTGGLYLLLLGFSAARPASFFAAFLGAAFFLGAALALLAAAFTFTVVLGFTAAFAGVDLVAVLSLLAVLALAFEAGAVLDAAGLGLAAVDPVLVVLATVLFVAFAAALDACSIFEQ